MIDIGILESHPVVRAGLRALIAEQVDLRLLGEATTVDEAIALVKGPIRPDVLIMDMSGASQYCFDAIERIRADAPSTNLLLFSTHPAEHCAIQALRQGARGYLNKNCKPEAIVEAVRTLALGRRYFSTAVTSLLADQLGRSQEGAAHERLSEREFEVFCKLARGETAMGIAAALALSVKTVSTYRARLLEKLSLTSNSDLTYYAFNNRLIS